MLCCRIREILIELTDDAQENETPERGQERRANVVDVLPKPHFAPGVDEIVSVNVVGQRLVAAD